MFLKNKDWSEAVDVVLSYEDATWDAKIVNQQSQLETKIQITTTFCEQMAVTQLHLNEHGDAPITHGIQTREGLARWKKKKNRIDPIAVDTVAETEKELELVADRIKAKLLKDYPERMILLVYSYRDFTEDHLTQEEIEANLLGKLSGKPLDKFSEVHLAQPRRNIRIR